MLRSPEQEQSAIRKNELKIIKKTGTKMQFRDLKKQYEVLKQNIDAGIAEVKVPGRRAAGLSHHGHILKSTDDTSVMICPGSGFSYKEVEPRVRRI